MANQHYSSTNPNKQQPKKSGPRDDAIWRRLVASSAWELEDALERYLADMAEEEDDGIHPDDDDHYPPDVNER